MCRSMKRFVCVTMSRFIFAFLGALAICSGSQASELLEGRWMGGLACTGAADVRAEIDIKSEGNGRLTGEVSFYKLRTSYNFTGTITSTTFELLPGEWVKPPTKRFEPPILKGDLDLKAPGQVLRGNLPSCGRKGGSFTFFRMPAREKSTPEPPYAKSRETDPIRLTQDVRAGIKTMVQRRDRNHHWWSGIRSGITFSDVTDQDKARLYAEVDQAQGTLEADFLLDELANGPKSFPEGIGRALFLNDRARASNWPDAVKERVSAACRIRIADVLRPKLQQIVGLAETLPSSLEGLIKARSALNEVETYKPKLEAMFGTLDLENVLPPVKTRIAAIEADPAVAAEFQAELDAILKQKKPLVRTEDLVFAITGYETLSQPLASIAIAGLKNAAFAEVVVTDLSGAANPREPSAHEIALHVFNVVTKPNAALASMQCAGPQKVTSMVQCGLGEMRTKLNSVAKSRCVEEAPDNRFICYFEHSTSFVSAQDGKPTSGNIIFDTVMPGGRTANQSSARFTRNAGGSWTGSALGAANRN